MLIRTCIRSLPLAFLALAAATAAPAVLASPINYRFTGSLDQPYNGSKDFNGTFSYEAATPGFESGTLVAGAAGASATLNLGGQSYSFQGSSSDGTALSLINTVPVQYQLSHNHGGTGDSFSLTATGGANALAPFTSTATMSIRLSDPTGKAYPPVSQSLPTLFLRDFTTRLFSFAPMPTAPARLGTITSLVADTDPKAAPIPEPSTLAFLVLAGIGVAVRRVRRV